MAQQTGEFSLKGSLKNFKNERVSYATIQILSSKDSAFVAENISDKQGSFKITNLPEGKYILSVTHLLYKRKYIPIEINQNTVLNRITLNNGTNQLNEVTVKGNAIQYKADRYIIHLQGNPITRGKNTTNVLGLLPGVTNEQGSLKINGQSVSQIYLDGHKLRDRKELDAIQSANIDKVEILPMSGSDEDGSFMGGVIYITLKKTPNDGFYGSSSGNFSVLPKNGYQSDNINTSFSYKHNKLSLYNYIAYGDFKEVHQYDISTFYKKSGQTVNMKTQNTGWTHSLSDRLSLSYEINKNQSIGWVARFFTRFGTPISTSNSLNQNSYGEPINNTGSTISNKLRNDQYQTSFNYDWLIDKKGSSFKFILDYLRYNNDSKRNNMDWFIPIADGTKTTNFSFNDVNNHTDMLEADAKLNYKISKGNLDAGLNYSFNNSKQLLNYQNLKNETWVPDPDQSDNYKLTGNNYAGYVSYSSSISKNFKYKAGLRLQDNQIAYHSLKMIKRNSKDYWELFPTVNLMYMINPDKGTMMNLSYQKSMNDIPYSVINPVMVRNSEYSYTKGNVGIKPSVYNVVQLGASLNGQWNLSYMFMTGKDILFYKTFQDTKNPLLTYTIPINDGKEFYHSFSINRTFKLFKWWDLRAYARFSWDQYQGEIKSSSLKNYFSIDNNFTFKNGWGGGNLSANLEPTSKMKQRTYKAVYYLYGSVYKYLLKNKLMLDVDFTIYSHNRQVNTNTPDLYSENHLTSDERALTFTLTYNFSGGKKVKAKQAKSIQSYYEMKDF